MGGGFGSSARFAWASSSFSALVVSTNLAVMSVTFDDLRHDFAGTDIGVLSWVLSVYTIVFGAFLVPAGRLADHVGRRRVFLAGLAVFSAASLAAALSPAIWLVIAGRVGQGIGAACLVPSTLGLLLQALPASQRSSATAFYSVIASIGGITGPTVGALIVDRFGWRAAFYLAPAFCLAAFVTGVRSLPRGEARAEGPLPDSLGALIVVVGLSALSLGIVQSREWGWSDPRIVASFPVTLLALVLFVRRCRAHPVPVFPTQLARVRTLTLANIAALLYGVSTGALLFSTVFFLREVWGYSLVRAGLGLSPLAIAAAAVSLGVGRLGNRYGERVAALGAVIVAAAMVLYALRVHEARAMWNVWVPVTVALGLGMGITYPLIASAAVRDVSYADLSVASASNRMALQIGNALGIALVFAIIGPARGADVLAPMRHAWIVTAVLSLAVAAAMARLPGTGSPSRTR